MIDELPDGWALTTFGAIFDFKGGNQPPKSEFSNSPQEGYIRLLQIRDFESDDLAIYIRDSDRWPKCNENDLMIGRYGASVGKILTGKAGAYNVALVRMIFDRNNLDTNWVRCYLNSELFQQPLRLLSRSAQNGFNKDELEEFELPLPPLAEQRRIVAKIEELTSRSKAARAALAEVPTLLEQFRQSVLASAFRGDLTADWRAKNPNTEPASALLAPIRTELKLGGKRGRISRAAVAESETVDHDEDMLPETWQAVRLRDVMTLQPGYAFSSKDFTTEGIRLLRGTNIIPNGTRWAETVYLAANKAQKYNDFKLQAGDIVVAMDRPIISTGIKVARLVESDLPALLLQRVGRIRLSSCVEPRFLYAYLQSSLFRQHIDTRETGTQLPHVSGNDIEATPFVLPPHIEQLEISRMLDSAIQRITVIFHAYQQTSAELDQLDQSILAKAFRGELVPQDPADEPAC